MHAFKAKTQRLKAARRAEKKPQLNDVGRGGREEEA